MQSLKENKIFKIVILVFAVIVLALSVTVAVMASKNRVMRTADLSASQALESAASEKASLEEARASEAQSYQNQLNEQSAAHASEKDALNQTIADLNKQISIKRAAEAAALTKPDPTPEPLPARPNEMPDFSGKTIYLTFDDGPSPRTPEILKILNDNGVKATFFVINGGKYNHYMKDIVAGGHTIALHSYTHDYATIYASDEAYFNDLQKISDVVYNETGVRTNLIRFPGGGSNTVSKKYNLRIMTRLTQEVENRGYVYLDWNLSSGDANSNSVPANTIINNCRKVPKSNAVIVLMHDAAGKRTTVEALPEVIAYYKAAGCTFAAIDASTPPAHQRVQN